MKLHDAFACKAAEGEAHADASEFGRVGWILVQSHEVVGRERGVEVCGDLAIEDEAEEVHERLEVGEVIRVGEAGLVQTKGFEGVGEVTVGSSSCAFFDAAEGSEEKGLVHGSGC